MTPLAGIVESAAQGLHGFDCNEKLDAAEATGLRNAGFVYAIRYLTRQTTPPTGDLSRAEAELILDAGLALMAVQHVAPEGWIPSAALGRKYGDNAVNHARLVGLPAGVDVWLDLEGVASGIPVKTVIEYCNNWFDRVAQAGYATGIYVGSQCRLGGEDLFWRLKTKHYWRSGSKVPEIPQRGYQLIQRIIKNDRVAGVEIDRNVTRTDAFGDSVRWLIRKA